jgi:hypothetical protein
MRLNFLIAACALMLAIGPANAATFEVFNASGTFTDPFNDTLPLTGTLTVDITSGVISNSSLHLENEPWTIIISQNPDVVVPHYDLAIQTPVLNSDFSHDTLFIVLSVTPSMLVVDQGGLIISGSAALKDAGFTINLVGTGALTPAPLPDTLPLFATGLGIMGLFGWRRKRMLRCSSERWSTVAPACSMCRCKCEI